MGSGFFALLDDIGALMDDVASMAKISTRKTAGILGDDLAVNAEKASGFMASREIPVLWAITKGSFLNKLIILPIAFLLSAFFPVSVTIILVLGGVYLAYEGAEKVYDYLVPHRRPAQEDKKNMDPTEILALEKSKIKSAVVTDFILSIEIVIIALGSVIGIPLLNQVLVVTIVAFVATVGVYGVVALIVRMDDFGYSLINFNDKEKSISDFFGHLLVNALPWVIKSLGVIGSIALLLVAGGIFVHNLDMLHHLLESWPSLIREFVVGLAIGSVAFLVFSGIKKMVAVIRK